MTIEEALNSKTIPSMEEIRGMSADLVSELRPLDKVFLCVVDKIIRDIDRIHDNLELIEKRQRNTETEMRQVHEKISSIEQSIANLRCMSDSERINRKNMCDVINAQADQLDRLNREVFDEEPEEVKE